jgi:hypothetical protein
MEPAPLYSIQEGKVKTHAANSAISAEYTGSRQFFEP